MELKMDQLVSAFTDQLKEAMSIAEGFNHQSTRTHRNVLVCGLGGSGIGGTILSQLISDHCSIPVLSSKDYTIPAFVNEHTLVIACSYSGNTEETLEAIDQVIPTKAEIVCVSSGGTLSDLALKNNWPLITVPGGYPPRAAFAFSLIQLFRIADCYNLTSLNWEEAAQAAIKLLDAEEEAIKSSARQLAESIQHKTPIIYSSAWLEGVAVRWRQQINENSKMLSWENAYPEQNHNELVGWAGGSDAFSVIFLTSDRDHSRVLRRMELSQEVYRKKTPHIHHVSAKGDSKIEQALYLIHLGDWASVFLAEFRGVDAVEVNVIDWLKGELSKF